MRVESAAPVTEINWVGFTLKKVKIFFWILRHGLTRTRTTLHRYGAINAPDCPFCIGIEEDIDNLFATTRPQLLPCWVRLLPGRALPMTTHEADESIVGLLSGHSTELGHTTAMVVLWPIWKSRNR